MNRRFHKITKLFIESVNIVNENAKKPRDYGIGVCLFQSEIHTLSAIYSNSGVNASELARVLGITNGAVTQVVNKLVKKDLLEKYNEASNKKEVYFRLTQRGSKACEIHNRLEQDMFADTLSFLENLDNEGINVISVFMEKLTKDLKKKE
jgi:DNA-binding MarR family transcriptional regulator